MPMESLYHAQRLKRAPLDAVLHPAKLLPLGHLFNETSCAARQWRPAYFPVVHTAQPHLACSSRGYKPFSKSTDRRFSSKYAPFSTFSTGNQYSPLNILLQGLAGYLVCGSPARFASGGLIQRKMLPISFDILPAISLVIEMIGVMLVISATSREVCMESLKLKLHHRHGSFCTLSISAKAARPMLPPADRFAHCLCI